MGLAGSSNLKVTFSLAEIQVYAEDGREEEADVDEGVRMRAGLSMIVSSFATWHAVNVLSPVIIATYSKV